MLLLIFFVGPLPSLRVLQQVVVVDEFQTLQYAQHALMHPAAVGGRRGGPPGVVCVGLDVENCPTTTKAKLLQVCVSVCTFVRP